MLALLSVALLATKRMNNHKTMGKCHAHTVKVCIIGTKQTDF